jgi:hypothetical protein
LTLWFNICLLLQIHGLRAALVEEVGEDRINCTGLLLDVLRSVVGFRFDVMRTTSYTSLAGRAARVALQLEGSRPSKGDGASFEGPSFFQNHHADLYGGPADAHGHIANDIHVVDLGQQRGELRWSNGNPVGKHGTYFRPLGDDVFFHLSYCGGFVLAPEPFIWATSVSTLRRPTTSCDAWPDIADVVCSRNVDLVANSNALKRSGDVGEVYFALAAITASHMYGLSAQPLLDEYVVELVAQLTGERDAAHGLVLRDFFKPDASLPSIPFASPTNTPWPPELVERLSAVGITLGNAERLSDRNMYDFRLKDLTTNRVAITGEIKNQEANHTITQFEEICIRTPAPSCSGGPQVHLVFLNSRLANFKETATKRSLREHLWKKRARVVRVERAPDSDTFLFADVFDPPPPSHGGFGQADETRAEGTVEARTPTSDETQTLIIVVELGLLGIPVLSVI